MSLISNVRLWKRDHDTVKASGKLTVANAFDIAFTLIKSSQGLFVSLPRRQYEDKKSGEKKWANDVFCIDDAAREEMTTAVLAAYENPAQAGEQAAATSKPAPKKVPF